MGTAHCMYKWPVGYLSFGSAELDLSTPVSLLH